MIALLEYFTTECFVCLAYCYSLIIIIGNIFQNIEHDSLKTDCHSLMKQLKWGLKFATEHFTILCALDHSEIF